MMCAVKYRNTDRLLAPFTAKLYCLILVLPLSFVAPESLWSGVRLGPTQTEPVAVGHQKHRAPLSSSFIPISYLSCSSVRDYQHQDGQQDINRHSGRLNVKYSLCRSGDADDILLSAAFILLFQMHYQDVILGVGAASRGPEKSLRPPPLLLSAAQHVASLPSAGPAHTERKEDWAGRVPVFSPSTRTWLRIIALGDALRLSALLCTTTLIRLLPWLMATSPPLEEKVNLYLIVSLPFSPGSFHHFFIYSASILADSEMRESLKLNLIS